MEVGGEQQEMQVVSAGFKATHGIRTAVQSDGLLLDIRRRGKAAEVQSVDNKMSILKVQQKKV